MYMKKLYIFLFIIFLSNRCTADIYSDKAVIGNTDYKKMTLIDYPIVNPVHKYSVYKPNPYKKNEKKEREYWILPSHSEGEDKSWYFYFGKNK